ncbi:hypothetical protein [Bacillus sp. ISL-57]|uniref:hypothetical protein n=1 Tax=Bacillus sp. ISL-57 TaxID=2819135 RepID=UPI001BE731C9|nr:hypothetical protein [Bacillus sp. ISL-57]MBT2716343.1 hypothetical protein [Bacillus sp. ISL-57]
MNMKEPVSYDMGSFFHVLHTQTWSGTDDNWDRSEMELRHPAKRLKDLINEVSNKRINL